MRGAFWDCLGRHNIMAESGSPGKSQAEVPTGLSRKYNEKMENDVFLLSEEARVIHHRHNRLFVSLKTHHF